VRVHLINPSEVSFGTAVITPRWLYVLAAATPASFGDPCLVDETLEPVKLDEIQAGDIVGIGIHTANALRGYKIGKLARERGAYVVFGGIHATLYPNEAMCNFNVLFFFRALLMVLHAKQAAARAEALPQGRAAR